MATMTSKEAPHGHNDEWGAPTATMTSREAPHAHKDDWEGTHGNEDK